MVEKPADYKDSFSIFCEGAEPCGQQQQQQQQRPCASAAVVASPQVGLGSRSALGERLNPPPPPPASNVYKRGGGLGGWLGLGWVGASKSQNPPAPYKRSLAHVHWGPCAVGSSRNVQFGGSCLVSCAGFIVLSPFARVSCVGNAPLVWFVVSGESCRVRCAGLGVRGEWCGEVRRVISVG